MPPVDSVRTLTLDEKRTLIDRINSGDGNPRMRPILDVPIERAMIDEENRVVRLSVSSETPVERWWGEEVLEHTAKAVDLSRLKPGVFGPVLASHDAWTPENHIGVVDEAALDEKRKKVNIAARFSKNNPVAEMIFKDIVDVVRGNASIGYEILDIVLLQEKKNAPSRYLVTKWAIYEVSFVSVPADTRIGVGRSAVEQPTAPVSQRKEGAMPDQVQNPTGAAVVETPAATGVPTETRASNDEMRSREQKRIADIKAMGEVWKDWGGAQLAQDHIRGGQSVDEFRAVLFERMASEPNSPVKRAADPKIGLSPKEVQSYRLVRLINALANPTDRASVEAAAFEMSCSQATAERVNRAPQGAYMPLDIIDAEQQVDMRTLVSMERAGINTNRVRKMMQARDLTTTGNLGGYTIATDLLIGDFIELLRNSSITMGLGRVLAGLNGNIQIPKQTGALTGYWVAEGVAVTESGITFGQLAPTPKSVGALAEITRLLLMQSSLDVEMFVRADIAAVLGIAMDLGAIAGTGGGQPVGILNTVGIGDVSFGANGGAPTWASICEFLSDLGGSNALQGRLEFVTNYLAGVAMMKTVKVSGYPQYLWDGPSTRLLGFPVNLTNQVPSNLTEGSGSNLSALILGNWTDLMFFLWGVLDILVDPYTQGAKGNVIVRGLQTCDIGVRHAESFTASKDMITT